MKKQVYFILLIMLSSTMLNITAEPIVTTKQGESLNDYFAPIFNNIIVDGGVKSSILSTQGNSVFKGIDQAIAMLVAVQLYDIYGDENYLDIAKGISDFTTTFLTDPSKALVASFYEGSNGFISNLRNMEDNLMLSWGFSELAIRFNNTLDIYKQENRASFLSKDISRFIDGDLLLTSFRVDNPQPTSIFNVYHNLFSAYIITEDESFANLINNVENVHSFVKENATSEKGGVYTLYTRGVHDEYVSLKNTALYALLGLKLFELTNTKSYLDDAKKSINYIKTYCLDIGLTGGYFELFIDDKPIQQSKSLGSHGFLLMALQKLVALGEESVRTDLLAIWETIMNYFKRNGYFLSTISRDGKSGSSQVATFDNLIMIYALTQMPLISNIEFLDEVDFSDTVQVNVTYVASLNTEFNLTLTYWKEGDLDNNQSMSQIIKGTGEVEQVTLEFTPPRPDSEVVLVNMEVLLLAESIVTDRSSGQFDVIKDTGLVLSTQTVTLFSVLLIIVFVYFLRSLQTRTQTTIKEE